MRYDNKLWGSISMLYKIMNGKLKECLENFLKKRQLSFRDIKGSHLFHYNLTNTEYAEIQTLLQNCNNLITAKNISAKTLLEKLPYYPPLFVLYASYWWQNNYDGSEYGWKNLLKHINITKEILSNIELYQIIEQGFDFWDLPLTNTGHKYLATIAREAGLPRKIITESTGSIGNKLSFLLNDIQRLGLKNERLFSYIETQKETFPKLYKNDETFTLIKQTISEIINLQQKVSANTAKDAIKELDTLYPEWKLAFPFSLDDEHALKFFENLLGEAIENKNRKKKQEKFEAERTISRDLSGYNLQLSLKFPNKISSCDVNFPKELPRSLIASVQCADTIFSNKYILDPNISAYTNYSLKENKINDSNILNEIIYRYSSKTGEQYGDPFILLNKLDEELPWVFEKKDTEQDIFDFFSQGGASSGSDELLIALPKGYTVHCDSNSSSSLLGSLNNFDRELYLIHGIACISCDQYQFIVKTNSHTPYSSLTLPHSAKFYQFISKPAKILNGISSLFHNKMAMQDILWKGKSDNSFEKLSSDTYGAGTIWIKNQNGNNIKERIILLPETADIEITKHETQVSIKFINWKLTAVTIAPDQPCFIADDELISNDTYELIVHEKELTVDAISEHIHLHLFWHNYGEEAEIFIPYPREGAFLYNPHGKKVNNNEKLCVSNLYGYRLMLFDSQPKRNYFQFELTVNNKSFRYELTNTDKSVAVIRLRDWENDFRLLLSSNANLDTKIQIKVNNNGKIYPNKWQCSSYSTGFAFKNGYAYMEDISKFSLEELTQMKIEAFCLSTPNEPALELEQSTSEGTAKGVWKISENLPFNGPWLLYKKDDPSIRPKLWYETNQKDYKNRKTFNSLQLAIEADEREHAFNQCIPAMCNDFTCHEWSTFYDLTQQLSELRLSTLDIWQTFIKNPRIMACLILNCSSDYRKNFMPKIEEELPFLWQTVPLADWIFAFNQLKSKINNAELFSFIFFNSNYPEEMLQKYIAPYLILQRVIQDDTAAELLLQGISAEHLFIGDNSSEQQLFRRHENDNWPIEFVEIIKNIRKSKSLYQFLPPERGFKDNIVCLPIVLAVQCYTGKPYLFDNITPEIILSIKNAKEFDPIWFDEAYYLTLIKCYQQKINIGE